LLCQRNFILYHSFFYDKDSKFKRHSIRDMTLEVRPF
jgi:hypothetical protein